MGDKTDKAGGVSPAGGADELLTWDIQLNDKGKLADSLELRYPIANDLNDPAEILRAYEDGEQYIYLFAEAWCRLGNVGDRTVRVNPPGRTKPYTLPSWRKPGADWVSDHGAEVNQRDTS